MRQAGGRLTADIASTLDVWDAKLATTGEELAAARLDVVTHIDPVVGKAYDQVASAAADIGVSYARSWDGSLASALAAARDLDLRRGVSTVGPHRDEVVLTIAGMPARTHASQGEQRSLALALRLAAHEIVTEAAGSPPILLLDDVFSELDPGRSEALLRHLPPGQAILTTAGLIPSGARPARRYRVRGGTVELVDEAA